MIGYVKMQDGLVVSVDVLREQDPAVADAVEKWTRDELPRLLADVDVKPQLRVVE